VSGRAGAGSSGSRQAEWWCGVMVYRQGSAAEAQRASDAGRAGVAGIVGGGKMYGKGHRQRYPGGRQEIYGAVVIRSRQRPATEAV